ATWTYSSLGIVTPGSGTGPALGTATSASQGHAWDARGGDWTYQIVGDFTNIALGNALFFDGGGASVPCDSVRIRPTTSIRPLWIIRGTGGTPISRTVSTGPTLNGVHAIALVQSGSTITLYVDGVSVDSASDTTTGSKISGQACTLGSTPTGANP